MSHIRIRKQDENNWALETFSPGGTTIQAGANKGKQTKPKWSTRGYYTTLLSAFPRILDECIAQRWPEEGDLAIIGEGILQEAVADASRVLKEAVRKPTASRSPESGG